MAEYVVEEEGLGRVGPCFAFVGIVSGVVLTAGVGGHECLFLGIVSGSSGGGFSLGNAGIELARDLVPGVVCSNFL